MRLLPRSLAGRLAALLVLTLVVAQVVTFLLFAGERITAFRSAYRDDLVTRLVSLVQLLEESPPELHERLLATANSPLLRLGLASEPLLAENQASDRLHESIAQALDKPVADVRMAFGRGRWAEHHHRHMAAGVDVSVRLNSG